jgi:hypothetical protein
MGLTASWPRLASIKVTTSCQRSSRSGQTDGSVEDLIGIRRPGGNGPRRQALWDAGKCVVDRDTSRLSPGLPSPGNSPAGGLPGHRSVSIQSPGAPSIR